MPFKKHASSLRARRGYHKERHFAKPSHGNVSGGPKSSIKPLWYLHRPLSYDTATKVRRMYIPYGYMEPQEAFTGNLELFVCLAMSDKSLASTL